MADKVRGEVAMRNGEADCASVVFINGPVITVNKNNEISEAAAVRGNKIAFVGPAAGAREWIGKDTEIIDLRGRSLMPGFIDAHMHMGGNGITKVAYVDMNSDKVQSVHEMKELLKKEAAARPKGKWIKCAGYEQKKLAEQRHPTIEDLDEAAPDHPVQVCRVCGHMAVYNSRAMALCGIKDAGQFAPGEVVVENGKLTGLIKENANAYMASKIRFTWEEVLNGVRISHEMMLKAGITSVHDAGFGGAPTLRMMQEQSANGVFKVRIYNLLYANGKEYSKEWVRSFISAGVCTGLGTERFKIGAAKILMDGSTSGPSSATRKPYSHDPNLKGLLLWNQEETDAFIMEAHKAGLQVTGHAVGDMAVEILVNAIEKAMNAYPRPNLRHRIEHCALLDETLIKRIRDLGIVPIVNTGFFNENGSAYVTYYGHRVDYMFPCRSLIENGVMAAIGSDAPVISENPMIGLFGAVTRQDKRSGEVAGQCQTIDLLQAIRMYTYNGAYASYEENIKGSIEEGKLADMIVLSEDIQKCPVEKIKDVVVDLTMIDGEVLYTR